ATTEDDAREGSDSKGAARTLAIRGIEAGDAETIHAALDHADAFSADERLVLRLLAGDEAEAVRSEIDKVAAMSESSKALLAAASSIASGGLGHHAGSDASRRGVALGHLLGHAAEFEAVEAAVDARLEDSAAEMKMLKLDIARRSARWTDVSAALSEWGQEGALERGLAAALVAERAGDKTQASASYRAAYDAYPASDVALRPLSTLDSGVDLASELAKVAEALGASPKGSILRIEATLRAGEALDDATKKERLDEAHEAAPTLPIGSFLAERYARRIGSIDDVLRYVRSRRAASNDPIEGALDAIREALLVVDADPSLAATRLDEAHHARPDDFALRELYERLAVGTVTDKGSWREGRAAKAPVDTKALLLLEAAYDYERTGDDASALRAATAAKAAKQIGIESIVLERAEVKTGEVARLADQLLERARSASDPTERREAYERLSALDATARNDLASALLWHKTILEDFPTHKPSLRYVEQALVGDGRDDELEPTAQAIAKALAGTEGGESSAHAGLSARLKMRAGDWDGTREMAELARSQRTAAIWALRLVNAHARAHADHQTDFDSTVALLERSHKPVEVATLLLRAADAATRLGRNDVAKEMLERATSTDPGDVTAWEKLARMRRAVLDAPGAAEAFEAVARTSGVRSHQLEAWYEAAIVWLDT
ncbi:MAG TPA: tetratricopeptide repeat protein, partial [Polyangiaceae bacterium]